MIYENAAVLLMQVKNYAKAEKYLKEAIYTVRLTKDEIEESEETDEHKK